MPNNNHIMIDTETLSAAPNPMIVSIGAVQFDPESFEIHKSLYLPIDLLGYGQTQHRFDIDPGTVLWWMNQEQEARDRTFGDKVVLAPYSQSEGRYSLISALSVLSSFCKERQTSEADVVAWSNDETADLVWLEHAYRVYGEIPPWNYRGHRCQRTIREVSYRMGWDEEALAFAEEYRGVKHNAADDAILQARYAIYVLKRLNELKEKG